MVAYLLLDIRPHRRQDDEPVADRGVRRRAGHAAPGWPTAFVLVTIVSEGALLFVAAQAGFIDGPRVLANMAHDSWVPHWFANLSERLATHNGVLLMGFAGLAALWVTGGNVARAGGHVLDQRVRHVLAVDDRHVPPLVGSARHEPAVAAAAGAVPVRRRDVPVDPERHRDGKNSRKGGWRTLLVTGVCVALCFAIRRYYDRVVQRLQRLATLLEVVTPTGAPTAGPARSERSRRRDPGRRLQRPGRPHVSQRHPLRTRPVQECRLPLGRRDRLGQFQGRRRRRGPAPAHGRIARQIRRPRPAAGHAGGGYHVDRHRPGRRARAFVRRRSRSNIRGRRFSPANSCFRKTPGISAGCTTRLPIRCSGGCNGTACRWSFCRRGSDSRRLAKTAARID